MRTNPSNFLVAKLAVQASCCKLLSASFTDDVLTGHFGLFYSAAAEQPLEVVTVSIPMPKALGEQLEGLLLAELDNPTARGNGGSNGN
jgi:hypothetical protein